MKFDFYVYLSKMSIHLSLFLVIFNIFAKKIMKKTLTTIALLCTIACAQLPDDNENGAIHENNEIQFQVTGIKINTKGFEEATISSLQNGWKCAAILPVTKSTGTVLFNETLSYEDGVYKVPGQTYYFPAEGTIDFYGCWPASLTIRNGIISYYQNPETDLITAKKTNVTSQGSAVQMTFSHALTQVELKCQGQDENVDYYLKGIYITAPESADYNINTGSWIYDGTTKEHEYFSSTGTSISVTEMQEIGSAMSFIPKNSTIIKVNWECKNKGTDSTVGTYMQSISTSFSQGMRTTVNLMLPNKDAAEIDFSISVNPWNNENKDLIFE